MLWVILGVMAWVRSLWSSTRRRSHAGPFQTNASPGRSGASKWTWWTWPTNRSVRSAGRRLARSSERKSSTSWRSLTVTSIFPRCPHSRRWTMCSIRVWKTFSRICTRSRTRSPMLWARQLALPWGGWSKTRWHCKGQSNSWSQMLLQCLWSSCKNRKSHYIVSEWIYTFPLYNNGIHYLYIS